MAGHLLQINFQSSFSARLGSANLESPLPKCMQAVRTKACKTLLVTVLLLSHWGLELKIPKFPGACHPGDHTTLNVLG